MNRNTKLFLVSVVVSVFIFMVAISIGVISSKINGILSLFFLIILNILFCALIRFIYTKLIKNNSHFTL